MRTLNSPRILSGIAAAALLAAGMSACSGEGIAENAAERALEESGIEGAEVDIDDDGNFSVEGDDGSFSVDSEGGEVTIEGEDGEQSFSSGQGLPEGFPEDDVPVPAGTVVNGTFADSGDQKIWSVTIEPESGLTIDDVTGPLIDAGLAIENETSTSNEDRTMNVAVLQNAEYFVSVTLQEAEGETTLILGVSSPPS